MRCNLEFFLTEGKQISGNIIFRHNPINQSQQLIMISRHNPSFFSCLKFLPQLLAPLSSFSAHRKLWRLWLKSWFYNWIFDQVTLNGTQMWKYSSKGFLVRRFYWYFFQCVWWNIDLWTTDFSIDWFMLPVWRSRE